MLWDVAEISRRRVEAALTMRADCTLKQFVIMDTLESINQNFTPTALASRLSCSRQNITQLVREMRARGWLDTPPEYSDRRSTIMRVTESGRSAYRSFAEPLVDLAFEQLDFLETVEKQRLATILRRLSILRWNHRRSEEHE